MDPIQFPSGISIQTKTGSTVLSKQQMGVKNTQEELDEDLLDKLADLMDEN